MVHSCGSIPSSAWERVNTTDEGWNADGVLRNRLLEEAEVRFSICADNLCVTCMPVTRFLAHQEVFKWGMKKAVVRYIGLHPQV